MKSQILRYAAASLMKTFTFSVVNHRAPLDEDFASLSEGSIEIAKAPPFISTVVTREIGRKRRLIRCVSFTASSTFLKRLLFTCSFMVYFIVSKLFSHRNYGYLYGVNAGVTFLIFTIGNSNYVRLFFV